MFGCQGQGPIYSKKTVRPQIIVDSRISGVLDIEFVNSPGRILLPASVKFGVKEVINWVVSLKSAEKK